MNQQKEVEDGAEEDMFDSFKDAAIHLMPSNAYSIFISQNIYTLFKGLIRQLPG